MIEKDIEDLICAFPQLFSIPPGVSLHSRQHYYDDRKIADVVFRSILDSRSIVVEVKARPLHVADLQQIAEYMECEARQTGNLSIDGFLIGLMTTRRVSLERAAASLRPPVECRYLDRDFFMNVKTCRSCLEAYWPCHSRCPGCGEANFNLICFDTA